MKKKMKKKDEIKADNRLRELGVCPRIYHFENFLVPFIAITIADHRLTWMGARRAVDKALSHMGPSISPATSFIRMMHEHDDIYGLAVCDRRDSFNRQRGRTIAKGRLWKHLKEKKR